MMDIEDPMQWLMELIFFVETHMEPTGTVAPYNLDSTHPKTI